MKIKTLSDCDEIFTALSGASFETAAKNLLTLGASLPADAVIRTASRGHDGAFDFQIEFLRDESPEEEAARMAIKEKERLRAEKVERAERRELDRLRKKYPSAPT